MKYLYVPHCNKNRDLLCLTTERLQITGGYISIPAIIEVNLVDEIEETVENGLVIQDKYTSHKSPYLIYGNEKLNYIIGKVVSNTFQSLGNKMTLEEAIESCDLLNATVILEEEIL